MATVEGPALRTQLSAHHLCFKRKGAETLTFVRELEGFQMNTYRQDVYQHFVKEKERLTSKLLSTNISYGVLQGSILGQLLLNLNMLPVRITFITMQTTPNSIKQLILMTQASFTPLIQDKLEVFGICLVKST